MQRDETQVGELKQIGQSWDRSLTWGKLISEVSWLS